MKHRALRVGQLIQEELGKMLVRELEFDGALVTITGVSVNKVLQDAKVTVGVIPSSRAKEVLKILHDAERYLQHLLLKKINIKPMPKIRFVEDAGAENAAEVEKILIDEYNKGDL